MNEKSWIEIGPAARRARFEALRESLAAAGAADLKAEFVACESAAELPPLVAEAKKAARAIRFDENLGFAASALAEEYPVLMLSLRVADAMEMAEGGGWWPRNYLFEGVQRTAARDLRSVDLDGSVLIVGSGPPARSAAAALAKIGFGHFTVVDGEDAAARSLAAEMGRALFGARFESTPRNLVTQLPGAYSLVVNASPASALELNDELIHMNFLKPGASWVELWPGPLDATLLVEAAGAGAAVEPGARVVARSDGAWAEANWRVALDIEAHVARLQAAAVGSARG